MKAAMKAMTSVKVMKTVKVMKAMKKVKAAAPAPKAMKALKAACSEIVISGFVCPKCRNPKVVAEALKKKQNESRCFQ